MMKMFSMKELCNLFQCEKIYIYTNRKVTLGVFLVVGDFAEK